MTRIVGFQSGHDVSYCVLENGVPVLCEEKERISRVKMELGDGLKFFFERYSDPSSVKYFTLGNYGGRSTDCCFDSVSDTRMKKILHTNGGAFYEFGHHLSHAANAFYTSNFDEALIITMDGGGHENDKTETAFTISRGFGNKIERIKIYKDNGLEINLGAMWWHMTHDVFGLSVGYPRGDQAGTVMAMAALGDPKYTSLFPNYKMNLQRLKLIAADCEKEKFNVASSLQAYTETLFRSSVSKYIEGGTNLCFSGGVSLNCVMLGKIRRWFPNIKNIFCDPVPYDAGLALGSARYLWHHVLNNPRIINNFQNMSPYLGKSYSKAEIEGACNQLQDMIKVESALDSDVLGKINDQKIVAVFGGCSESGRRALGNRSILADPRNRIMKALVNEKVKHRSWFSPLAPSILEERTDEWFEEPILSPYMTFALKFRRDKQSKVPAVVHYVGTGRVHTVNKNLNPWYHNFLTQWEKISDVPILINTSFNDNEPIVETPRDALLCFIKTNIDFLYFYDYGILVSKK